VKEISLIKSEIRSIRKNQGYWHDGQDLINDVEPLKAKDLHMSIISFFLNPPIKWLVRKGSNACGREAAGW
jgi:hypothetical protein